ncbi:unnamed protein product [Schistosoma guineensis]|nr:unnamed protein product [Schistosoma guineensis]
MLTTCDTSLSRRLSQLVITIKCATFSSSCKSLFSKSGDLFADLLVDNTFVYKTKVCHKTWNPTWNESISVIASPKSIIQIKVFNHFKLGPDVLIAVAAINLSSILIEHNGILSKCELRLSLFQGCDYKGSVFVMLDKLNVCVQNLENGNNMLDNLPQVPSSSNGLDPTPIQHQRVNHSWNIIWHMKFPKHIDNPVDECDLDLYFIGTYDLLGALREDELIEGGKDIKVTEENKSDYIRLMVDWRFNRGVKKQTEEIHKGIFEVLNPEWLELFDERELELLLSGMPEIDVDDWEKNTVYIKYTRSSKQIIWFWKLIRKLDNEHRARLLQFVTGTCHLPLGGFSELTGE